MKRKLKQKESLTSKPIPAYEIRTEKGKLDESKFDALKKHFKGMDKVTGLHVLRINSVELIFMVMDYLNENCVKFETANRTEFSTTLLAESIDGKPLYILLTPNLVEIAILEKEQFDELVEVVRDLWGEGDSFKFIRRMVT
jgi:hypothetical protein